MVSKHMILLLITTLATLSSSAWVDKGTIGISLSSQCAVADSNGDARFSGGLGDVSGTGIFNYLNSAFKIRVTRSGTVRTIRSRVSMQLKTRFAGWLMSVSGFSCEGGNSAAYYNGKTFYFGVNDHSNDPKCMACEDNEICEGLGENVCTPNFGSCTVQDGRYAYIIGGTRGLTFSTNIRCIDLADGSKVPCPKNFGSLSQGVHNGGCAIAGNTLVVVGGGYQDKYYANRIQICTVGGGCTIHRGKLANPLLSAGVFQNLEGNPNCEVVVLGGETTGSASSGRAEVINFCGGVSVSLFQDQLPVGLRHFGTFIANGLLCVSGGLSGWTHSKKVYCRNWGGTPSPATTPTKRPTAGPVPSPTNQPSRNPTTRPTGSPTMNPVTAAPSSMPTPAPTYASIDRPDWKKPWWTRRNNFGKGISAAICGVDPKNGDIVMGGGRQHVNGQLQQHNAVLRWGKNSDLGSYSTLQFKRSTPSWGFGFVDDLRGLFVQHQASVRYKGRIYVCSPQYWNAVNTAELLKCEFKTGSTGQTQLECHNLCRVGGTSNCPSRMAFSPCCVGIGKYLYWIGGNYGLEIRNKILKFDMDHDVFVDEQNSPSYGPLVHGTDSAACGAWNDNIYVFGGNKIGKMGTRDIQVCKKNQRCTLSQAQLPADHYYGRAISIGSQLLIGCGSGSGFRPSVPSVYDGYTDRMDTNFVASTSGLHGRTDCCLGMHNGNVTVLGGFSDSSVSTNSAPRMNRLEQCNNLIIAGPAHFAGSYVQVRIPSLKSSHHVWRSFKNWIYYSDSSRTFWIWSSQAYAFSRVLRSGSWTSYQARGLRSSITLGFTCNDRAGTVTSKPKDPCASMTWECPALRAVVIALCALVGCVFMICGCIFYMKTRERERESLKIKSVSRVGKDSSQSTGGTLSVGQMFPDANPGAGYPMQQRNVVPVEEEGSDDSGVIEDDRHVVYDMEERPGDVDEAGYYYHQQKFTQDVLFPQQ